MQRKPLPLAITADESESGGIILTLRSAANAEYDSLTMGELYLTHHEACRLFHGLYLAITDQVLPNDFLEDSATMLRIGQ